MFNINLFIKELNANDLIFGNLIRVNFRKYELHICHYYDSKKGIVKYYIFSLFFVKLKKYTFLYLIILIFSRQFLLASITISKQNKTIKKTKKLYSKKAPIFQFKNILLS